MKKQKYPNSRLTRTHVAKVWCLNAATAVGEPSHSDRQHTQVLSTHSILEVPAPGVLEVVVLLHVRMEGLAQARQARPTQGADRAGRVAQHLRRRLWQVLVKVEGGPAILGCANSVDKACCGNRASQTQRVAGAGECARARQISRECTGQASTRVQGIRELFNRGASQVKIAKSGRHAMRGDAARRRRDQRGVAGEADAGTNDSATANSMRWKQRKQG